MEEKKIVYFWKCPECGNEQKVVSSYFHVDGESSEKCSKCGKRARCFLTKDKKNDAGVVVYTKE